MVVVFLLPSVLCNCASSLIVVVRGGTSCASSLIVVVRGGTSAFTLDERGASRDFGGSVNAGAW